MGPVWDVYELAHMGKPIWFAYGQTHMGTPIKDPYGAQIESPYEPSMGCIRACTYVHAFIGPIWVPFGQAHIIDPCRAQIAIPYGPSVGCIRVAHVGTPIKDPYGSHTVKHIWTRPYRTHVDHIRTIQYGLPIMNTCGAQIPSS